MKIGNSFKILGLVLGLCSAMMAMSAPKMVDSVAAVVNNDVVLESSVLDMIKTIRSNANPKELPDEKTLRHQVIERLIVDRLIMQQADKSKITITDTDVTNAINRIAQQNGLTLNELRSHLNRSGINYNSYRERIRSEIIIEEVRMNEVRRRITITPQEVDALAKVVAAKPTDNQQVNVSHILIAVPESPSRAQLANAQNKADMIVSKLRAGESFAKLAASYSNDELAFSGGSLGWRRLNELPSLFESTLIRAQKGDIVGPLRSGVGFHILKVNDTRREARKPINVLEVNARHILLKTTPIFDDAQAKALLLDIRKNILTKATTFAAAAKEFSEDPGTMEKGGELGWNMPDRYDDAFKSALLRLKKGEISQPVKSAFGWHLIQLIDTRKEDRTELAQKDQAYRMIFNRKFTEEAQVWVQELMADAYINIIEK